MLRTKLRFCGLLPTNAGTSRWDGTIESSAAVVFKCAAAAALYAGRQAMFALMNHVGFGTTDWGSGVRPCSFRMTISTRRLCKRPSSVSLDSRGTVSA